MDAQTIRPCWVQNGDFLRVDGNAEEDWFELQEMVLVLHPDSVQIKWSDGYEEYLKFSELVALRFRKVWVRNQQPRKQVR